MGALVSAFERQMALCAEMWRLLFMSDDQNRSELLSTRTTWVQLEPKEGPAFLSLALEIKNMLISTLLIYLWAFISVLYFASSNLEVFYGISGNTCIYLKPLLHYRHKWKTRWTLVETNHIVNMYFGYQLSTRVPVKITIRTAPMTT